MKTTNDIDELEARSFDEDDSPDVPPTDIVAYNESRSCADLYRMYHQGILDIKPEFQREIVWKGPAQTRFIDSLIKQLPIPSLCFSLDFKTQRWQVIDGLQRMACIVRFLGGDPNWTLSRLDDIEPKLAGVPTRRFLDKDSDLYGFYQRVENLTLPITVLRCDYSKKSHTTYLFTIFHRLNTGAMKLNNQEIRNCIYTGVFNDFLHELNQESAWLKLNRMKRNTGYRFRGEELILRFFALTDGYSAYGGRLAAFLNDYIADRRNPDEVEIAEKRRLFKRVLAVVFKLAYDSKPRPRGPLSVLEATFVGVAKNIDLVEDLDSDEIKRRQAVMLEDDEFKPDRLSEGLSGKDRLKGRLDAATAAFAGS